MSADAFARARANAVMSIPTIRVRAQVLVTALAAAWSLGFAWLAVVRHLADGSHAEDLGFTDQVLANFLRGQWFRMSIYDGATWNTELDLSRLARPDSLLAFHFEPMLLLLVPLYALGGGAVALLVLQAAAVGAGAIPAYRLGRQASHTVVGGVAVAAAYLLSPLGQWAVLADFHTSTLAAPLLLLSVERLAVGRSPRQALISAGLAATAREDVGPIVAVLGAMVLLRKRDVRTGAAFVALGVTSTVLGALIIRHYSGGISPFELRYGATLGDGFDSTLAALTRPSVLGYVTTLLLSGGWLGLFAPLDLLPALPSLALNALSSSPWMAAGKAHYSALVLPFVAIGAAAGLSRLSGRFQTTAGAALILSSLVGYFLQGAGPFGGNYAPAVVTHHSAAAASLAAGLPREARVSASSSLVPRVSTRPGVYIFPTVLDADYIFLDLKASPAPTSAGDVYLRVRNLVSENGWRVQANDDGLLLLHQEPESSPIPLVDAMREASYAAGASFVARSEGASLVAAALVPPADGAVDVDGPLWTLRTTWRTDAPLPSGTRLEFRIDLSNGERLHRWDVADLWWNPPEAWPSGKPTIVDVPDVPIRLFRSWAASWTTP